jgi:hypothetical protein
VPIADAGIGLPWIRPDLIHSPALQVEGAGALGTVFFALAVVDSLYDAAVAFRTDVVMTRHQGQPIFLTGNRAIRISDSG